MSRGADVLVRASWRHARWLDENAQPLDLLALLKRAGNMGYLDRPIWLGRKKGSAPLAMRLVALRKPRAAVAEARRKAHRAAQREGRQASDGTLLACEWVILVTSLSPESFPTDDIFRLYRMRWRIELAFKRLKSLRYGLRSPPHKTRGSPSRGCSAISLVMIRLLVEPLADEFGVSPS